MTVGNRQRSFWRTGVIGCAGQQGLEVANGLFVVARGVLGIAQPEARGRQVATLRELAQEGPKGRSRVDNLAGPERGERRL